MATTLSYGECQSYLRYKEARAARFARLRQAARENAAGAELTGEEALALVDEVRQEVFEEQRAEE